MAGDFTVGLLGHGTVGAAFAQLLDERADEIERFNGRRPVLGGVLTRSRGDFEEILAGADLIVEVMGGIEPAREHLLRAMRSGKDVVTANKQLLAQHGEELYETAREHDVRLRFEAAVGGVVPVVRTLEESLSATPIERIHGIVNGTTNYILTEMSRGASYAEALAEAQRNGYAEADPGDDVTGRDAAAKMAILARLAFGAPVHLDEVRYEGIEHLHSDDLEYARELDLALKLVGTAERRQGGLSVSRAPDVPVPRAPAGLDLGVVQRGHRRVRDDHRDHALGSRRRRAADGERGPGRRRQRDDRRCAAARAAARRCR